MEKDSFARQKAGAALEGWRRRQGWEKGDQLFFKGLGVRKMEEREESASLPGWLHPAHTRSHKLTPDHTRSHQITSAD